MDLRIYIFMQVLTSFIDNHSFKMALTSLRNALCLNQSSQRATYFTQHTDWELPLFLTHASTYCLFSEGLLSVQEKEMADISFYHGAAASVGRDLLSIKASRSHSDTHHSVGLL